LGDVFRFAWDTTALAVLYRQLGYVFRAGVRQIVGYFSVLQVSLVFIADLTIVMYILLILYVFSIT